LNEKAVIFFMKELTEEIYKILTQRRVRRAWPKSQRRIKNHIKNSLKTNQRLVIAVEWLGVKTVGSGKADNADKLAISFLRKNIVEKLLQKGVKNVIVKILFGDTNASYLDGYNKKRINLYWKTLKKIVHFSGKNFKLFKISEKLYPNIFKLNGNENITLKEISEKMKAVDLFKRAKRKTDAICKSSYFKTINPLTKAHSLLVKNKFLTVKEATKRYIFFRIFTSILYEKFYPNEIFLSYTYPEINNLIISQPIIYTFSIGKGCSKCPWFVNNKKITRNKK